jgi:hypothetical protein
MASLRNYPARWRIPTRNFFLERIRGAFRDASLAAKGEIKLRRELSANL